MLLRWFQYLLAAVAVVSLSGVGPAPVWGAVCLLLVAALHLRGHLLERLSATATEARATASAAAVDWLRRNWFPAGLAAICALGLAAQLVGIRGELGHAPIDVDEHRLTTSVRYFFDEGVVLHETVEHYPGLYYWYLVGVFLMVHVGGLMAGIPLVSLEGYVLAVRVANAFLGTGTILLVGLLARRFSGRAAGLGGAALLALSPLAVHVGTQARNEAAQTLALVAVVAVALGVFRLPLRRRALVAGALAGIATAIKYSSVFALLPALGVVAFGDRIRVRSPGSSAPASRASPGSGEAGSPPTVDPSAGSPDSAGASAGPPNPVEASAASSGSAGASPGESAPRSWRLPALGLCLLGFAVAVAVTNHFVWADFPTFVAHLSVEAAMTGAGHWAEQNNPAFFYTRLLARDGIGWPLLLLAAGFAVHGLASGWPRVWLFLALPAGYWWFMSGQPAQFPRWVYPVLPFAVVAGVAGFATLAGALRGRRSIARLRPSRWRWVVAGAALLAVLPWLPYAVVELSRRFTEPSSVHVEEWLRDNAGAEALVVAEHGWLDLSEAPFEVARVASLRRDLGIGRYLLAHADFIVVPEPSFDIPQLAELRRVHEVYADRTFAGNRGFDYRIYAPPAEPAVEAIEFLLDEPRTGRFLGTEWQRDRDGPGLAVPRAGARLYLPPLGAQAPRLEFEIQVRPSRGVSGEPSSAAGTGEGGAVGESIERQGTAPDVLSPTPLFVEIEERRLELEVVRVDGDRVVLASEALDRFAATNRVVELVMAPDDEVEVRLLRLAVR